MIVSWVTTHNYPIHHELWWYGGVIIAAFILRYFLNIKEPPTEPFTNFTLPRFLTYFIFPLAIYVTSLYPQFHRNIDVFHDGEKLAPLVELASGKIPYKDFYLQRGFFTNVGIPWVGAKLFGESVYGVRLFEWLLEPLVYVLMYFIGLRVFRGGVFTSLLLVLICGGSHNWIGLRNVFALLSIWFLLGSKHSNKTLVLAGVSSALAFWHSVEIGLYILAGVGLYLLPRAKQLSWYLLGSFMVLGLGVGWLYSLGAGEEFFLNTWEQCAYQLQTWGLAFPGILDSESYLAYFPILVFFTGIIFLREPKALLLLLIGVIQFRTALGRSDSGHIIDGALYAWPVLLLMLEGWFLLSKKYKLLWSPLFLLSCFYLYQVHEPHKRLVKMLTERPDVLTVTGQSKNPRIWKLKISQEQEGNFKVVTKMLDKPFFDFTNSAALYFLENQSSPTRYSHVAYASMPDQQERLIDDLWHSDVEMVLYSFPGGFNCIDGLCNQDRHSLVNNYLLENFPKRIEQNGIILLLK